MNHAAIRDLTEMEDLRRASALFDRIWGAEMPMIRPELLRALAHCGNYLAGAFDDGEILGACVGFLGLTDGRTILHSHILGVAPEHAGLGIGFALKRHQGRWATQRDILHVQWTFDPLVARNAFFNLTKLRARVTAYYQSFYGEMNDAVNSGDFSDRVLVEWIPEGRLEAVKHPAVPPEPVLSDFGGEPAPRPGGGSVLSCAVPPDIVAVRREDPERAMRWRLAARGALTEALAAGYEIRSFDRSNGYLLEKP